MLLVLYIMYDCACIHVWVSVIIWSGMGKLLEYSDNNFSLLTIKLRLNRRR